MWGVYWLSICGVLVSVGVFFILQTIYEEGMYGVLIFLHFYIFCSIRQEKLRRKNRRSALFLLFAEGHAVGALVLGGAGLMSTYQDPVQRAVVCGLTVVGALLDGALDALVCVVVHGVSSFFRNGDSMTRSETVIRMRPINISLSVVSICD